MSAMQQASSRGSFAVVSLVLGLFLAAASAPSPLYALWSQEFGFSALTLTAVFAVYAASLLAALLTTGGLSDALGRRPVVLGALLLQAGSLLLFLLADGVAALYAGRLLQGLATGVVTAALSAWLLDVEPAPGRGALINGVAPTAGLATGALLSGALVQYAPSPLRLVWTLLLVAFAAAALATHRLPEPVQVRRRLSLRPRLAVPVTLRPAFTAALPCLLASWALGGFALSLGPSLLLLLHDSTNRLLGAMAVVVLTGSGALAILGLRHLPAAATVRLGTAALFAGVLLSLGAVLGESAAAFVLATAVAGAGFGLAFTGAFRSLAALTSPQDRAGVVSTVYIVSYLAFSVPALLAGALVTRVGLQNTAISFSLAVSALAAAALLLSRRVGRPAEAAPSC